MVGTLAEVIDSVPATDKTLLTVNRQGPDTLLSLLRRAFDGQAVDLDDRAIPEGRDDIVLLVEEGQVTATSPMTKLRDTLLLVNSDHYRTGANVLEEAAVPDVLAGLTEVEFVVRGFPVSNKEKLLLVVVSRLIEARALSAGEGTYHVGFQYLSRLDTEYGTRTVHKLLTGTQLDVHIYGARDRRQLFADGLRATVHSDDSDELSSSWFVVYEPPADDAGHIALVADEVGDNEWRACWTEDVERVEETTAYLKTAFC